MTSQDAEHVADDDSTPAMTPQERAVETITAIAAGADPTLEAFRLSNDFTDRQAAKFFAWFGRWRRLR